MTETPDVTRSRVPSQYMPPPYEPVTYVPATYVPPRPPPAPDRAGGRIWVRLVVGGWFVVTAVIALGVGVVIGASRPPVVRIVGVPTVRPTFLPSAVPSARAAAPSPSGPAAVFGAGRWLVGKEIRPGRYRTTVPADSYGCYWERERGTSGRASDVIASGSAAPGRRVAVTVKPGDRAFRSDGCGTWKRA